MALPDHLVDLERKISARLNEALDEVRHDMRRAVEAGAQQANAALLSELDKVGHRGADGLLAENDFLQASEASRTEGRRDLARSLRLALVTFDRARTQGAVLEALLAGARPFGDRVALWLMRPSEIVGWSSLGFAGDPVSGATLAHLASPALGRLAEGRGGVLLTAQEAAQMASALATDAPQQALFIPLVLRDRVAAVLYIDAAATSTFEIEALQLLALAAAQRLELQALATRSFTPTLYLGDEAPASERGLAMWDPESSPATAATAAPGEPKGEREPVAATLEPSEPQPEWLESPAPSAPAAAAAPVASEISWQMEEADETLHLGSVPHKDLMAEVAELAEMSEKPGRPEPSPAPAALELSAELPDLEDLPHLPDVAPLRGTPTHEIPLVPSSSLPDFAAGAAAASAASEWREVDESTAPHSNLSAAATQMFSPPAVTHEIPQPVATTAPETHGFPGSGANTIAFVPPVLLTGDSPVEESTVRIDRSSLLASVARPKPSQPSEAPEALEEQTHPSMRAPGLPEEEPPTVKGGPRTTEVVAPPDLQGPGWAFSSARSPRGSGDNALHEEARRLARLLVSEIKLYNEDQVEEGRHNRDIYHRLKEDIDRSRQIYEERVHESVRGTTDYFQQELIRSLAGGDPRALGI